MTEGVGRVENEVGQLAPLDGHEKHALIGVIGGENPLFARAHRNGPVSAGPVADAASQTAFLVGNGYLSWMPVVWFVLHLDDFHGTGLDTLCATLALVRINPREPVGRNNGVGQIKALDRLHFAAAATATIADIPDLALDVVGGLGESCRFAVLEDFETIGIADSLAETMTA